MQCPTCELPWTGVLYLGLARAFVEDAQKRVEGDPVRLKAAAQLADALVENGQGAEAEATGRAAVAAARKARGPDDPSTLHAMHVLASVHSRMDEHAAAATLLEQIVEGTRRARGDDARETLLAAGRLGATYVELRRLDEALPLLQEASDGLRAACGREDPDAILALSRLASLQSALGNSDEALHTEAVETARRALGSQHPTALLAIGEFGLALRSGGDQARAAALLQEAVAGLAPSPPTAAEPPQLARFRAALQAMPAPDPAVAAAQRRRAERQRRLFASRLPSLGTPPRVVGRLVGIDARPELNGVAVDVLQYRTQHPALFALSNAEASQD